VTELALTRRSTKRKGSGEGRTGLPLRRSYIRAVIEQKPKHQEATQMGSTNTRTPEEINEIRAALAMPIGDRIERMEAFIEELDKEAAITGGGTEEMRMSGARLLDEEAMQLTQNRDEDYRESVRQVVGNTVQTAREDDEVHGSIHYLDRDEYEAELKQVMKERGYDV
jgi:hypothetical protein